MNNLMIDIETLSNNNRPVVLSIGAVFFDPYTSLLSEPFSQNFPAQLQIEMGRHVKFDTIKFWIDQEESARTEAFKSTNGITIQAGLTRFNEYINKHKTAATKVLLWSNGPAFDSAHLNTLYQDVDMRWPFSYNADRDCRTIFDLAFPYEHVPIENVGNAHNPVDDAIWQAKAVQLCYSSLLWTSNNAPR
jgi:hypothetical protein